MLGAGLDALPAELLSLLAADVLAALATVANPPGLVAVSPRAGRSATPEGVRGLVDRPDVSLSGLSKADDSPEVGPVVLDAPQRPADEEALGVVGNPVKQDQPVQLGHAILMRSAKDRGPDVLADGRCKSDHAEQERMIPEAIKRRRAVMTALGVMMILDEFLALMEAHGPHLKVAALGRVEIALRSLCQREEVGGDHGLSSIFTAASRIAVTASRNATGVASRALCTP